MTARTSTPEDRHSLLLVVRKYRERAERSPGLSSAPFSLDGWKILEAVLSETGDRHRVEVEEILGAAFADALQEDFDGIRELVRAVKITFPDGAPIVTIQALRDAYSAMAEARGINK